ncbi:hypothetical protein [Streptomyces europaeiscabiei]|uniref:hypothetical protein n=1 Tax=Streptomyces europaeiscabiei TaxID=146819 RepID=UPI000A4DC301|nr:hypothetical protein [Streptomyces europaeiscabiei]
MDRIGAEPAGARHRGRRTPDPGVSVSPAPASRASTRPRPATDCDTDRWGRPPIGLRLCGVDRLLAHGTATDRTSTDHLTSAGFWEPTRTDLHRPATTYTDRRREHGI